MIVITDNGLEYSCHQIEFWDVPDRLFEAMGEHAAQAVAEFGGGLWDEWGRDRRYVIATAKQLEWRKEDEFKKWPDISIVEAVSCIDNKKYPFVDEDECPSPQSVEAWRRLVKKLQEPDNG